MLEGIRIITPAALWLAPLLLATLLYLYRRGGLGAQVITPSLMILKKLRSQPQIRTKIMPPWRLLFELFLGLLLILGIAELSSSKPEHIKVIVDNSLSMATLQLDGRSRLVAAKTKAISFIESLASNANLEIIATSPQARAISLTELKNLEAESAPDLLTESVEHFIGDSDVQKIAVFSDKKLLSQGSVPKLRWENMQPSNDGRNFSFKNLSFNPIDNTISASITLYSNDPAQAKIRLETNYGSYKVMRLVEEKTIKLSPETTQTVVFSGIDRDSNFAKLSLTSVDFGRVDDNTLDNVAYLALERQAEITLVSNFDRKDLGIDKLGLPIRTIDPEIWERSLDNTQSLSEQKDKGVIFHRYFPQKRPYLPAIIILPSTSSFAGTAFNNENLISSWKQPHPLTRYINLQNLKLNQGRIFTPSDSLETVISSELGPVVAIDTTTINRTALVGFELLPFKGSEDLAISILTLNLLNWTFEKALNSGSHTLFERIKLPSSIASLSSPSGERLGANGLFLANKVGIWRAHTSLGPSAADKFYAINLFSDSESDILHPTELTIGTRTVPSNEQYSSLLNWLAAITLALLLLDSLVIIVRRLTQNKSIGR